MKWTIHELKKMSRTDPSVQDVLDLNGYLHEDIIDIIRIHPVSVSGSFRLVNQDQEYWFDLHIKTALDMPCAITLETVSVPIEFDTELIFSRTEIDDSTYVIHGITIDLDPILFAEILVEKPYRVTKPGVELSQVHQNEVVEVETEVKNPFQALKKN